MKGEIGGKGKEGRKEEEGEMLGMEGEKGRLMKGDVKRERLEEEEGMPEVEEGRE